MSDTQHTSTQLYRRLLSYAFQYKAYFVLSIIGFALFSGSQSALLFSLELFLNSLQGKETEWLEKFPIEFAQSIYVLPIFVIFLGITRSIGSYLGNFYISRVGMNVVNTLRKEAFKNILYLPQSTFDNNNSGSYVSLILYNVGQVQESVTRAIKTLLEDGIFLIFLLVTLFSLHWKLTMVFAVTAPLLSGIVYLAARYFRRASRRIQTIVGKVSHITNETVQGISVVKSYTAEKQEIERFSNAADTSLEYTIKFERAKALQSPIMHFVITLALAAILFLIVFFWPENDAGSAVVYVGAAFALGAPIKKLSLVNSLIQRGLAAAETIFSTIDAVKEQDSGSIELEHVRGDIKINSLNFSYNDDKQILKNVSLDIHAGQTVAFVGQSGSGKTTLASLLQRFYRVDDNRIYIDGNNLNDIALRSLRDHISLVGQSAVIFDASVEENVCYGDEHHDQERMNRALIDANAIDFVNALANGKDTELGENGSLLSGGQRQRIAIARALYKDSPILILDEATSALDNESEKQIQIALERLMENRTTIVIAHRLSTIQNADRIVVMDNGEIIESGTHSELLEKDGAYARLYYLQPGTK